MISIEDFLKTINEMGSQVEREWKKKGYSLEEFPSICEQILNRDVRYSLQNYIELLGSSDLPEQHFKHNGFGDVPITLYRSEKFFIDTYNWNLGHTNVHNHNFCGAFKVLNGRAHNTEYSFNEIKKISDFISHGQLETIESGYLNQGDVKQIKLYDEFIHKVLHLAAPTVTLLIRTNDLDVGLSSFWGNYKVNSLSSVGSGMVTIKRNVIFCEFIKNPNNCREILEKYFSNLKDSDYVYFIQNFFKSYYYFSKKDINDFENFILETLKIINLEVLHELSSNFILERKKTERLNILKNI